MKYQTGKAYEFYKKFIYNEEKQTLLAKHRLHVSGSVPSIDWELFGAILTGDKGKAGYGSDLEDHEIKSSLDKCSFEYQYHLNGGKNKLREDMRVNHVFISYSPDYRSIEVRYIGEGKLKSTFGAWLPGLEKNYSGDLPRQRYRKSISYGIVKREGKLIMKVENGDLVQVSKV